MFKEVLQIVPKVSSSDLSKMESTLSDRFSKVAKKFGKGLVAALTGGGIAGAALGLIDKLLNPLKETQEAIDKTLKQSGDIVTNAKQFNTTAGKLFRLQQLAKSKDLDEGTLATLLAKFQGAVAEAAADPTKETSVRNFVGHKDTAEAFFEFIQGLQKLNSTQQTLVEQEIFGERQMLNVAKFLHTDFAKQTQLVGGPSSAELTPALAKLDELGDLKNALEARRNLNDVTVKSKNINEGIVRSQNVQEQLALDKENKQIKSYENLAAISIAATEVTQLVKDGIVSLTSMLVKVTDLGNNVRKLTESRMAKGFMKLLGGSN